MNQTPQWNELSFGDVLDAADNNVREGRQSYPDVDGTLAELHRILLKVAECVQHDGRTARIVPRLLMVRVHATLIAAARLAWGGQIDQVYPLLRVAIEQAWYALHLAADPDRDARAKVWLCRNDSPEAQSRCKAEFLVARVRATHESFDPRSSGEMRRLYEWMIDFGAHPNQMGALSILQGPEGEGNVYGVPLLTVEPLPRLLALRMTANVGVGALSVFRHIFPERWAIAGLDVDSDRFHARVEHVFGALGAQFEKA